MRIKHQFIIILACSIQLIACSTSKNISTQAAPDILSDSNLLNAHVGISIYDPSSNKYLYTHQAEKYFIPASNTKLFTCYAAMKHLGDSLVGVRVEETWKGVNLYATGDPTFLHADYQYQPVFSYMKARINQKLTLIRNNDSNYERGFRPYGYGWPWSDYGESYMPERSAFPIYGNVATFSIDSSGNLRVTPPGFLEYTSHNKNTQERLSVRRSPTGNSFFASGSSPKSSSVNIPFITTGDDFRRLNRYFANTTDSLLSDTLGVRVVYAETGIQWKNKYTPIHSQPTDSVLKPMMHRSDNFFAEQTLLMVSNEMTGVMNDAKIIDSLLKTDLKDLPQKPRWVDGSGLSRYNLFSPNDMVAVLNKMRNEFDWNRITTILPTGGEGTLSNYYLNLRDKIFAKTGTLSNNIALSGFLITKQNKTLIFSVLVNNHMGNTTQIRKTVEKFLTAVTEKY